MLHDISPGNPDNLYILDSEDIQVKFGSNLGCYYNDLQLYICVSAYIKPTRIIPHRLFT